VLHLRNEAGSVLSVGPSMARTAGNFMINAPKDVVAHVHSTDADSFMSSISASAGQTANLHLKSANKSDVMLTLAELSRMSRISHCAASGNLIVQDDYSNLLTISRGLGGVYLGGNLTIGTTDSAKRLVLQTQNISKLDVQSDSSSMITLKSNTGLDSSLILAQAVEKNMTIHFGSGKEHMVLHDQHGELVSVEHGSGSVVFKGNLQIGGRPGAISSTLRAAVGSQLMSKTKLKTPVRFKSVPQLSLATSKVCFMTKESSRDSVPNFIEVPGSLLQSTVRFANGRTILRFAHLSGPHLVEMVGLSAGYQVQFQQETCSPETAVQSSSATAVLAVSAAQSSFFVPISNDLSVGTFRVCIRSHGSTFTVMHKLAVVIVAHPSFSPLGGMAGVQTNIAFSSVEPGDFIVMQPHDCSLANATISTSNTLGVTAVDSTFKISTLKNMSDAVRLQMCYATSHSLGDESSDFVNIGRSFRQTKVALMVV